MWCLISLKIDKIGDVYIVWQSGYDPVALDASLYKQEISLVSMASAPLSMEVIATISELVNTGRTAASWKRVIEANIRGANPGPEAWGIDDGK